MGKNGNSIVIWTAVVVLAHLVIAMIHGTAHTRAHVPLSPAANAFVYAFVVAGPLTGLALVWAVRRIGALLIALSMAGAFIFGFINHFVADSPDHISHVDPQWRVLFAVTAVLLALTEALGCSLAIQSVRKARLR
jgi:hypothetical protein